MGFKKLTLNKILLFTGVIALVLVVVFWFWWGDKEINITNRRTTQDIKENLPRSSISGIPCENYNRRPLAVMLSSDSETRPLSGISMADIVFEMPVTPGGVTRTMALYQCEEPEEIGSIRSAREDFIPLAAGLDSILVHWGGEKEALKKLNNRIIDNIDAMVYEKSYFLRKKSIPQPHNGFTDLKRLMQGVNDLKYAADHRFTGYLHSDKAIPKNIVNFFDNIFIDYPHPFNVRWDYDKKSSTYKRSRGEKPEIDRNNGKQVVTSVIAVIRTGSKPLSKDYLSVTVTGGGSAAIFQNGTKINGTWQRGAGLADKLFFYDNEGKEIEFTPGKIWVEIVAD